MTMIDNTGRIKNFKIFGFPIKSELNLNTILQVFSLITIVGTAIFTVVQIINVPLDTKRETYALRQEIGNPGEPGYVPGMVKGLNYRMNKLEGDVKQQHEDTLMELQNIEASIQNGNKDAASRFDRLDNRMDRLVESTAKHK